MKRRCRRGVRSSDTGRCFRRVRWGAERAERRSVRAGVDAVGYEGRVDVLDAEAVPVFAPEKIAAHVPVMGEVVFEVEIAYKGRLRGEGGRKLLYGAHLN